MPNFASHSRVAFASMALKTGLQVSWRTGDDFEHLRGCGICCSMRFAEIAGALAQFVEQPRVLDGDDGLSGEVLNKLDLLFG